MRYVRLFVMSLFAGLLAALVMGFVVGAMTALLTVGPRSLATLALHGFIAAGYGLKVTLAPAILLGGLLWLRRVRSLGIWSGAGAAAGLGCFIALFLPRLNYDVGALFTTGAIAPLVPAYMAAGIAGALIFRVMMEAMTGFDEELAIDD